MEAATEAAAGVAGSTWMVPESFENSPRTFETIRWRTLKWTDEWTGRSCQVTCGISDLLGLLLLYQSILRGYVDRLNVRLIRLV